MERAATVERPRLRNETIITKGRDMQRDKYNFRNDVAKARALFLNALATGGYGYHRHLRTGNNYHPLGVACQAFIAAETQYGCYWGISTIGGEFVDHCGGAWVSTCPIIVAEWLGLSAEAVNPEEWAALDHKRTAQLLADGDINPFEGDDEPCVGVWLVVALDEDWPPRYTLDVPNEYRISELVDADATGIRGAMQYAATWNEAAKRNGNSDRLWAIVQPGIKCPVAQLPPGILKAKSIAVSA